MTDFNELEQFILNENYEDYDDELIDDILDELSCNSSISIETLVQICDAVGANHLKYIQYNPNLTINDVEKYYGENSDGYKIFRTIGAYYDIFSDNRIILKNGYFYYKNNKISVKYVVKNKYLTYELFKSLNVKIHNNDYVCLNPNGNFRDYDFTNVKILELESHINGYCGVYSTELEETILKYGHMINIVNSLRYLSYEFIMKNSNLFNNYSSEQKRRFLCKNKLLSIDEILSISYKLKFKLDTCDYSDIFKYANITVSDIKNINIDDNDINNNIQYFMENKNCSINDILITPELNKYKCKLCYLSSNTHYKNDTDTDTQYIFKFVD
jgi:hypothetical protein